MVAARSRLFLLIAAGVAPGRRQAGNHCAGGDRRLVNTQHRHADAGEVLALLSGQFRDGQLGLPVLPASGVLAL
jgi:hypothetical protein